VPSIGAKALNKLQVFYELRMLKIQDDSAVHPENYALLIK
jgi:hypothetical protein